MINTPQVTHHACGLTVDVDLSKPDNVVCECGVQIAVISAEEIALCARVTIRAPTRSKPTPNK